MKSINVEIQIPEEVDRTLNVLRAMRGLTKKAIVSEALEHYARCVGGETTNVIRGQQTSIGVLDGGAQETPGDSPSSKGPAKGDVR